MSEVSLLLYILKISFRSLPERGCALVAKRESSRWFQIKFRQAVCGDR